jgi:hypothetical protein
VGEPIHGQHGAADRLAQQLTFLWGSLPRGDALLGDAHPQSGFPHRLVQADGGQVRGANPGSGGAAHSLRQVVLQDRQRFVGDQSDAAQVQDRLPARHP